MSHAARFFDESALAQLLGVHQATLRRWRREGEGPAFVRVGARIRYDPADVDQYIAERRNATPVDAASARRAS